MLLLVKCLSSPYMIYLYAFDNFPYVVFLWNIRWAQLFTLGILYVRYIGRRFNFKFDQVNSNLNRVRLEDFRWLISQVIHIWYRLKFLAILIKVILRKFTKRIKIFRMLYVILWCAADKVGCLWFINYISLKGLQSAYTNYLQVWKFILQYPFILWVSVTVIIWKVYCIW